MGEEKLVPRVMSRHCDPMPSQRKHERVCPVARKRRGALSATGNKACKSSVLVREVKRAIG